MLAGINTIQTAHLQVLQVSARKGNVRHNLDLAIAGLRDGDLVAEVTSPALDLDLIMEELLESREVEDFVGDWLRAVDGVLAGRQHRVHFIAHATAKQQRRTSFAYLLGHLSLLSLASLSAGVL